MSSTTGKKKNHLIPLQEQDMDVKGKLWPSDVYARQVEGLKAAVGRRIYLVEIHQTDINVGVRMTDKCYELLDVIEFPRPDPQQGIFPHLILLDDGRGVNLGRIARITVNTPFDPTPANILYQRSLLMQTLLSRQQRLSKASIAARSKLLLGKILGRQTTAFIIRRS